MSESPNNESASNGQSWPAGRRFAKRSAGPLLLAASLAVALHVWLLSRWDDRKTEEPAVVASSPQANVVEVRSAVMTGMANEALVREAAPPTAPAAVPTPVPSRRSNERKRPAAMETSSPAGGKAAPVSATAEAPAEAPALPAAAEAPQAAGSAPSTAALPEKVPVYATRTPPSTTLRYVMSRGPIAGEGELRWQQDGRRYELRLEGRVPLLGTLLTQVSRGGFDAAGLAPERHTDKRRRRGEQAANFQRDAGLITFSGSSAQYPLVPGAQDRVSWMIQLAAIAQAWRGPLATGEHIVLLVASARGDADVWSFRILGQETVALPAGSVQALKLLREPRRQYDTKVEVWLDPARQYLPVRARLTDTNGDPLELQLSEEIRAP